MTVHRLLATLTLAVTCPLGFTACTRAAEPDDPMLPAKIKRLLPLHEELPEPGPSDWLANHPEPGQTFREYVRSRPVKPDRRRRVIYVQPLGEFTDTQRKIIELTAKYMEIYFDLPVSVREDISLDVIPAEARRTHPSWGDKQILTTYVLEKVLYPKLPDDAVAYIAFTTSDLWPGPGWNFLFGQASFRHRVGVWSIYRKGDPHESDDAFRLCLRRTIKTATHETGHMFSMMHCTAFECNMCGSNHLAESDRHPLWLCPHCLAKLCWATGADEEDRFERLAEFCEEVGLDEERAFFERSLATLRGE
jgi:archaemetzincin